MPKELCHWIIARQAALALDATATPRTSEAVRTCPDALLLGAVAPDAPFYLPKDPGVVAIATLLHGKGAVDAYAPVKRVIAAGPKTPPAALAFAAGVLCHIAADTTFHPAVFYFTGFSSHPDVAVSSRYLFRHRSFEMAMDLRLLAEHGSGLERRLDRLVARARAQPYAGDLLAAIARCYATSAAPPSEAEATRIFEQAGRTQRLFFSKLVWSLLRIRHCRRWGRNADPSCLFYASSAKPWATHFAWPLDYRDPVSGEEGVFDFHASLGKAVDLTISLCASLERAVAGDLTSLPQPGPSLESGHPLDRDQQMRHCDPSLRPEAAGL